MDVIDESRTAGLPTLNKPPTEEEARAGVTQGEVTHTSPAENSGGYSGPPERPTPKKRGNPNLQKGGPSLNPLGASKKPTTKATKVRQGLYDVFINAGGPERLERQMKELKSGKTKEDRRKKDEHDQKFYKFGTETIPKILPKEVFEEKEERILIFKFSDGTQERLTAKPDAIDAEVIGNK